MTDGAKLRLKMAAFGLPRWRPSGDTAVWAQGLLGFWVMGRETPESALLFLSLNHTEEVLHAAHGRPAFPFSAFSEGDPPGR